MKISDEVFDKFLKISKAKENYRSTIKEVLDFMFTEIIEGDDFKSDDFINLMNKYNDVINDRFPEVISIIRGIYDNYLTEQDLKDMIEFYSTPIGKKYLEVSTPMSVEILKSTSIWSKIVCKEIVDDIVADELKESLDDMRGEETWST